MTKILTTVFLIAVMMIVGWSIRASAAVHPNGEEFLSLCNASTGDEDGDRRFARCEELVRETRDDLKDSEVHGVRACIPENVPHLALIFAGIIWLEDNPDELHKDAHEILANAYARRWPCGGRA